MGILNLTGSNFDTEVVSKKGKVLVDFYADWCGPCRMMGPIMEEIAEELKGEVEVFKVNVDDNQNLAVKYNVMSIPTIILFENGEEKKSFIGVTDKNEIINAIK